MAQFAVQWLISAKLVLDASAMAGRLVLDVKLVIILVDAVRRARLPLMLSLGRGSSLVGCGVLIISLPLGSLDLGTLFVHDCSAARELTGY